jgi:AraC family transcriptional regulator
MLGRTEFSLRCGETVISKTAYDPHMVMAPHTHELAYVSLVIEGRYTEHRRDAPRMLHRNMLVFHPAGDTHADCVHDCSMATVNLEFRAHDLPRALIVIEGDEVEYLTSDLLTSLSASSVQLSASIDATVALLRKHARVEPRPHMLALRESLRCSERKRAISELAADAGMHRVQLHRLFKRTYGDSPRADMMKKRCAAAAELLASTDATIAQIAATCGFYDHSQFCRQFKVLAGLSPRRYRLAFQLQ